MEEIKYKVINRINTVNNTMYISEDGNYVMNVSELFCDEHHVESLISVVDVKNKKAIRNIDDVWLWNNWTKLDLINFKINND